MPLSYEALARMQAEMLDRYNLQAVEVRLSGENIAQLQQTNYYGSPIALRYMLLPVNTIEFFVPRLHRNISLNDWDNFRGWPGMLTYSVRSGEVSQSTYTPPTERIFVFDDETFVCRLSMEPVLVEPQQVLRSIQMPSIEPQLRATHANLAAETMQRLSTAVQDRIAKDILTGYDPRYSMGGPPKPKPQNRIDFLLEVLDDGVDEPHAED